MMVGLREEFDYRQCSRCGTLWLPEPPADLVRFYSDGYYSMAMTAESASRSAVHSAFARILLKVPHRLRAAAGARLYLKPRVFGWVHPGVTQQSTIGDVGAGQGELLRKMVRLGFTDLWGIDPFIEADRRDGPIVFRKAEIGQVDGRFDVLMFNHSLEHVPDPLQTLVDARERLNPGGSIVVRLPVAEEAWERYGVDWVGLDAPRHLFVPTVRGFQLLAERAGLSIERTFFDSEALQIWGSERYRNDIALLDEAPAEYRRHEEERAAAWEAEARALNKARRGDNAGFVLVPKREPAAVLFNPLPMVLARVVEAAVEGAARTGVNVAVKVTGPSTDQPDVSQARKLFAHVRGVVQTRRSHRPVVVMWPALGWLEVLLWFGRDASICVHDPVPLRSQVGMGRVSRTIVRLAGRLPGRPRMLTHTEEAAAAVVEAVGPAWTPGVVELPILARSAATPTNESAEKTVLVAGQFKPVRDLDLLEQLGDALVERGYRPIIMGRGWPAVRGWEVQDRFVEEVELDEAISCATAVLIPYQRYWQSGIAARALEEGTPVVGRPTEFLSRLFGSQYEGRVEEDTIEGWLRAIEAVAGADVEAHRSRYVGLMDADWARLLNPA